MIDAILKYSKEHGSNADLLLFRFAPNRQELEVCLLEGQKGLADILLDRLVDGHLGQALAGPVEPESLR